MPIKINPCKVCGGEVSAYTFSDGLGYIEGYRVQCLKCGNRAKYSKRKNVAIKAWNAANPISKEDAE